MRAELASWNRRIGLLIGCLMVLMLVPPGALAQGVSIGGAFHVQEQDDQPPATVVDLRVIETNVGAVVLQWTAPGDDGQVGLAAQYHLRFSPQPILSEQDWRNAQIVHGLPSPLPAGTIQSHFVDGLEPGTTYYFVLKTTDSTWNWSALSNCAQGMTTQRPGTGGTVLYLPEIKSSVAASLYVPAQYGLPPLKSRRIAAGPAVSFGASGLDADLRTVLTSVVGLFRQVSTALQVWWQGLSHRA